MLANVIEEETWVLMKGQVPVSRERRKKVSLVS